MKNIIIEKKPKSAKNIVHIFKSTLINPCVDVFNIFKYTPVKYQQHFVKKFDPIFALLLKRGLNEALQNILKFLLLKFLRRNLIAKYKICGASRNVHWKNDNVKKKNVLCYCLYKGIPIKILHSIAVNNNQVVKYNGGSKRIFQFLMKFKTNYHKTYKSQI